MIRLNSPSDKDSEEYYLWLHAQYCEECFEELLIKEMAKPVEP